MIILVMGLPGSGKSHFASRFAALIGAEYISSDRIRATLFSSTSYSRKEKLMVYEGMLDQAARAAEQGRDVVLDSTFYTREVRKRFLEALQIRHDLAFIEVVADEGLIKERLKRPRLDSDANFEVYREIKEEWEPFDLPHLVLRSSNENIDNMLDQAVAYLQEDYND